MKKRNYIVVAMAAVSFAACSSKAPAPAVQATVPASWFSMPENAAALTASDTGSEEAMDQVLENVFTAQSEALEKADFDENTFPMGMNAQSAAPSNLTRWHVGGFMTDLSVSASGILGSLTGKGTPAVILVWRKKEPADQKPVAKLMEESTASAADISINEETSEDALETQLNDTVQVVMAGGKVANESALRENLRTALTDFRGLTRGLENNPGHEWWVSRIRLDLGVEASGKVAHYFTSIGGDVRVRLEWHRIKSKKPRAVKPATVVASNTKRSMDELVNIVSADLSSLSAGAVDVKGFKPYNFRVGVGITASGTIGIAKVGGSVTGHIYFSKDVAKPKIKASNLMLAEGEEAAVAAPQVLADSITMIESGINPEHVSLAEKNGTRVEKIKGAMEQVLYRVDRAAFRRGLKVAGKMAKFFTRRAHHETAVGRWNVYEMKVGFDTSFTGKLPVATVGGLATAEVALYNQEF